MADLSQRRHLAVLYADGRDRRKSPRVPGAAIAIFAVRRDRRIEPPISGMSDIGDYIRWNSPSVPVPAIFYVYCCELPVKLTHQVRRFYHEFLKLPHRRDRRKKSQVCPHQSVAKITCDFRWRSNSPRSAYKIANKYHILSKVSFKSFEMQQEKF